MCALVTGGQTCALPICSGDPASDLVPHSPQRATPGPHVPHAMAIAAAILLIVLTGLSLNRLGMFGSRTIPVTELASKIGEIRTVALEDGSRVTLDPDTILHIAYSPTDR